MNKASKIKSALIGLLLVSASGFSAILHAQSGEGISLAGTTWSGTDSDGDFYAFTFEHNGTLSYKSPTGSYENGKWNQYNHAIYFEMNNHVSEYIGEINGNFIEGKAWNKKRRIWAWKVKKQN